MSTEGFSPSWLRLREPFDHAARSRALADRFAAALPRGSSADLRLLDLGCGRGSNLRFLAPLLHAPAHWCLADHDPVLLAHARAAVDAWSRARPAGGPVGLELRAVDLRATLPAGAWDGVVTQALLDLVSEAWLVRLADWLGRLGCPFLAGLTVDGRVDWHPVHPLDDGVQAAFRAHQRLDRGFGPSPGPRAAAVFTALLEQRGWSVVVERADWQVPAAARDMLRFMVDGTAEAARVTHADPTAVARWRALRHAQVDGGQLSLRVGHLDLLAEPPPGPAPGGGPPDSGSRVR